MREHKHLNFKSLIFSHAKSFQDMVFHPRIGSIALLNFGISEIVQVSRKKQMWKEETETERRKLFSFTEGRERWKTM